MWSTIEGVCRRDIEFPAGAHALHIEVRGGGVAIVRMTGAQSGTLRRAPDHARRPRQRRRRRPAQRGLRALGGPAWQSLGPIQQQTVEGGDLKVTGWSVNGPVGAGIQTVIVQPLGQPQIVATVMNGWFSAWWPVQPADPNAPAGGALQPHVRNMPPSRSRASTRTAKSSTRSAASRLVVPKVGFEPTRGCPQRCLRPQRLPFRHFGAERHPNRRPRHGCGTRARC